MPKLQKITPFMWFDSQAEEAAKFYTGIFRNAGITTITHYGEAGKEIHGRPPGSVMTVGFELEGQNFTAMNGGPVFKFTPAISFVISCDTQDEIDYYWNKLSEGGDCRAAVRLAGRQIRRLVAGGAAAADGVADATKTSARDRAMAAILKMKKIDIETLKRAAAIPE